MSGFDCVVLGIVVTASKGGGDGCAAVTGKAAAIGPDVHLSAEQALDHTGTFILQASRRKQGGWQAGREVAWCPGRGVG